MIKEDVNMYGAFVIVPAFWLALHMIDKKKTNNTK
jgi:hypothetical protein